MKKSTRTFIALMFATMAIQARWVTPYMQVATANIFILWIGWTLRHHRKMHGILMTTAILSDLGLVGLLQWERHAIQTAVSFKLSLLNQLHIGFATLATVLYVPVLWIGWSLLRQQKHAGHRLTRLRKMHLRVAIPALIFRTLGYFLMYSMLFKPQRF
jgi:hypothetical protein